MAVLAPATWISSSGRFESSRVSSSLVRRVGTGAHLRSCCSSCCSQSHEPALRSTDAYFDLLHANRQASQVQFVLGGERSDALRSQQR